MRSYITWDRDLDQRFHMLGSENGDVVMLCLDCDRESNEVAVYASALGDSIANFLRAGETHLTERHNDED